MKRLRAVVCKCGHGIKEHKCFWEFHLKRGQELEAQVERMKEAELEVGSSITEYKNEIRELQASSARMRSALEEIALENIVKDDCAATGSAVYMQRIATEALLSTKDGEAIQPTGDGA